MTEEYLLTVIKSLTEAKKGVIPYNATMAEVLRRVREDALEGLRGLVKERKIVCHRTINDFSFSVE